jgi:OOP family OmpA-OmpF porin
MKKNTAYLLLIFCCFLYIGSINAQENNYITSKYDFIPGEKVIFFDDFTSEAIGDFPAQWLTNGSGEIVTSTKFPGRWFSITKMGYYIPEAVTDFTENFTIEFDFVPMTIDNGENMYSFSFYLLTGSLTEPGGGGEPGDAGFQVYLDGENFGWKNWSMATEQRFNGNVTFPFKTNQIYHIAIWVQKQRVRLYANETKVLDVPRGIPGGSKTNIIRFETRDEAKPLISNFRIAAGLSDMRNRLLNDGKIVSYGILFDVNSDKVKPESYATLRMIADILKENPAIRLQVVGHTDSDGDDASNLDLSKRRGVSVKNELVTNFGIDASRLDSDGKGETEPIAENNSSVNKAKNRRVEFINMKEKTASIQATAPVKAAPVTAASITQPADVTGSFKDPRDGKTYKTVKIGTQTWMSENLAFKTDINSIAYDNNENNGKIYGYLYNWENAMKVCPSGWHLPSLKDWNILIEFLGGEKIAGGKMKETGSVHWESPNTRVTNSSGFTALPGGMFDGIERFSGIPYRGYFWSAEELAETNKNAADTKEKLATFYSLSSYEDETSDLNFYVLESISPKTSCFSVRCLKD